MDNITSEATPPVTIDCLPTELLAHIFTFLDSTAPSDLRLHDQPSADFLRVPNPQHSQPLKTVSQITRTWRATVLPLLFRNAAWYLDRRDLQQAEQAQSAPSSIPLLPFLHAHNLAPYVKTLTLVIIEQSTTTTTTTTQPARTNTSDVGLYRRGDGSGHYGYSPEPMSPPAYPQQRGEKDVVFNEDSNWLWRLLLADAVLRPRRFTLVASPRMLASLTARMLFLGDEWIFSSQSHHVLSLSRDDDADGDPRRTSGVATTAARDEEADAEVPLPLPSPLSPSRRPSRPSSSSGSRALPSTRITCDLFTIQPWTAILLNEGSSTPVYKTYEYFHRRPPSILGALLGAEAFPNDVALAPPTLRELSYVGIFPLSEHFSTLVDFLPRVERLFVQLVPRNDILKDRREMKGLDMDDLWAERNSAYASVMPKLFEMAGNWKYLQEFETGDAADEEGWRLAVGLVGTFPNWRVDREGVFVRRTPEDM